MTIDEEDNTVKATFRNSIRGPHWVLLVVLGLSFAVRMSAVDRNYFIGNWMNVNKGKGGIKAMQIGQQDDQTLMRAWGACTPNPCKWGQTKVSFYATNVSSQDVTSATAVFRTSFSITRLTMRPGASGTLEVEVMTHFTDNSGRSDYTNTDRFRSVSWDQWDSNIFN